MEYSEGVFVGYRYYTSCGRQVLYPFGHGLSYTEFSYEDLHLSQNTYKAGEEPDGNGSRNKYRQPFR